MTKGKHFLIARLDCICVLEAGFDLMDVVTTTSKPLGGKVRRYPQQECSLGRPEPIMHGKEMLKLKLRHISVATKWRSIGQDNCSALDRRGSPGDVLRT